MAYRNWHDLPSRYIWRAMRGLNGVLVLSISLSGMPSVSFAQENPTPSLAPRDASDPHRADALASRHTATPDELRQWIDELRAPLFDVREQAVRRLSRCDASAVQPLREAAAKSTDLEVKSRCLAIADAIFEQDVGKRTKDFMKDPDPEKTYGFDGWHPFSKIVGRSRLAKRLFADLVASHPNQALLKSATAVETAAELQSDATGIFNKFRMRQDIELSDSVSLLYRTVRLNGEVSAGVDQVTVFLLRSAPLTVEISRPPMRSTLQKLIGAWMKVTHGDASSAMMIALDHEIPEGVEIARRELSDIHCDPSRYMMSISTLMRFGNSDDVELLKKWRSEPKLIQKDIAVQVRMPIPIPSSEQNQGTPNLELGPQLLVQPPTEIQMYELRYQDMALAASAYLMKREDIQELFPRLQTHPNYVFQPKSLALPQDDDSARQRIIDALAKETMANDAK